MRVWRAAPCRLPPAACRLPPAACRLPPAAAGPVGRPPTDVGAAHARRGPDERAACGRGQRAREWLRRAACAGHRSASGRGDRGPPADVGPHGARSLAALNGARHGAVSWRPTRPFCPGPAPATHGIGPARRAARQGPACGVRSCPYGGCSVCGPGCPAEPCRQGSAGAALARPLCKPYPSPPRRPAAWARQGPPLCRIPRPGRLLPSRRAWTRCLARPGRARTRTAPPVHALRLQRHRRPGRRPLPHRMQHGARADRRGLRPRPRGRNA